MTTRLRLDELEAREVPAIVTWVGTVSEDAGDPLNWAIFVHGPPIQRVPEAGDDVLYTGVFNEDHGDLEPLYLNCVNMHGPDGGGAYNSVTLDYAYTDGIDPGRVTLSGGFTTKAFHLAGGIIDQPSTGFDITVSGNPTITSENEDLLSGLPADFTWTGGTLNSTETIAGLIITDTTTTALIAPASGGTVNLGSHLNFENGAIGTMKEGTINLLNDGIEFNIFENCGVVVDPGQDKYTITNQDGPVSQGNPLRVWFGGWFKVLSGRHYDARFGSAVNEGTFILMPGASARFATKVPSPLADYSFWSSGAEQIAADATLELNFMMRKTAGAIFIQSGTKPQGFEGNLVGDLKIINGDIRFEDMSTSPEIHEFGEFRVKGNVIWDEGTYYPFVSSENNNVSDQWTATGTFSIGANAQLVPTAVDAENLPVPPPNLMSWTILSSVGGFANVNKPSFDANIWDLNALVGGGGQTLGWYLKKKFVP